MERALQSPMIFARNQFCWYCLLVFHTYCQTSTLWLSNTFTSSSNTSFRACWVIMVFIQSTELWQKVTQITRSLSVYVIFAHPLSGKLKSYCISVCHEIICIHVYTHTGDLNLCYREQPVWPSWRCETQCLLVSFFSTAAQPLTLSKIIFNVMKEATLWKRLFINWGPRVSAYIYACKTITYAC